MAQHIKEPNYKCAADDDLYGTGEQFSKWAKPNAQSTIANDQAHVAQELMQVV